MNINFIRHRRMLSHLGRITVLCFPLRQLLTKYQIFKILPQISHFHKNHNFSSIFTTLLDQLLHPYKSYGRDMSGILFFIFASCEPLSCNFDLSVVNILTVLTNELHFIYCLVTTEILHFLCIILDHNPGTHA